ncbi:MAG: R3H domain-containing nucleic acid-binding protein [Bdellovibrionota bacterium]
MNIVKSALNLFGISKDDERGAATAVNLDEFLTGLPPLLGYDIHFERHQKDDGSHHIEVTGGDILSLIGENTQILDAIAHISMRVLRKQEGLANKAVEEGTDLSKYRVTVDAEGFRDRHYEGLKKVAEDARKKVLENNGRPTYIPALSPAERRIIHTHLATLGEVTSESIGNGTFKRIRIKLITDTSRPPRENGDRPQRRNNNGPRGDFRKGAGPRGNNNRGPNRGPGGQNRGPRANPNAAPGEVRRARFADEYRSDEEINGNRAVPDVVEDDIDDNIGNK